jgi:hypothetical protein
VNARSSRTPAANDAMIPNNATKRPKAMVVDDFGVYEHDDWIRRGRIQIEEDQEAEEFDASRPLARRQHRQARGDSSPVQRPGGFARRTHGDSLALLRSFSQVALAIGVHDSEDWKSIALGCDHKFAFVCAQVVEAAKE